MKAGVGFSTDTLSFQAGKTAAAMAVSSSGNPVLSVVFTTDQYDHQQLLAGVKDVVGDSRIVGFCTGGVITDAGVLKQGVGICAISGDTLKAVTSLQAGLSDDPSGVGRRTAEALLASGAKDGTVFVLPNGFGSNISEMLRGLYNTMGPDFKYVGGGSGDTMRFLETFQFTDGGIEHDAVSAALLEGAHIETGIGHGWTPIGSPLVITEACKKRVIEIDGVPAFQAYSKRLGDISVDRFLEFGMKYPFGFPDIFGNYLIRDPLSVNEDQSIDFITEIPSNAVGSLMEGNVEELTRTAREALEKAVVKVGTPAFALFFDCISRYMLMGDEFEKELQVIKDTLGADVPMLGTLSFGEVGSYEDVPLFHNKTLTAAIGGV